MAMTTIETKTEILAQWILNLYDPEGKHKDFIYHWDLIFDVAQVVYLDMATLTDTGSRKIEALWEALLTHLDKEDVGFEAWWDFDETWKDLEPELD